MPRALGQIDARKTDAILDAAAALFAERGAPGSLDAVAARAGVSKQTVYNRFGGKAELVRALVERRAGELTSPLDAEGAEDHPLETLTAYAENLLRAWSCGAERSSSLLRLVVQHQSDQPELARMVWEAGPRASRAKLAAYLAAEARAGRLAVDDAEQAAEFFIGMALGQVQMRALLGAEAALDAQGAGERARACAERFLRAYGV